MPTMLNKKGRDAIRKASKKKAVKPKAKKKTGKKFPAGSGYGKLPKRKGDTKKRHT